VSKGAIMQRDVTTQMISKEQSTHHMIRRAIKSYHDSEAMVLHNIKYKRP
jgi:hypothetical protein